MTFSLPYFESVSYTTSDAADERSSVDLGGRRIIKKKKKKNKKKKKKIRQATEDVKHMIEHGEHKEQE